MKRKELIDRIATEAARRGIAWTFVRNGARHDLYRLGNKMIPVERHRELDNGYAEMVYRECGDVFGRGWWK